MKEIRDAVLYLLRVEHAAASTDRFQPLPRDYADRLADHISALEAAGKVPGGVEEGMLDRRRDWNPDDPYLDPEVRDLCIALNSLPAIHTTESCCGHGEYPMRIWFNATDLKGAGMWTLARMTCSRYYGDEWHVELYHTDVHDTAVSFMLESKRTGQPAYEAAVSLAARLKPAPHSG